MRISTFARSAATPAASLALAVALLGLPCATSPAHADGNAVLPVEAYGDIVVDDIHRHVFLSDPTGDSVVVTDFDGTVIKEIENADGAFGLALSADSSTVYVALRDAGAVAALSTDSLTESGRWTTGEGSQPQHLAVTGGKVFFGYGATGSGRIGSLDPAAATPVELALPAGNGWYYAPELTASPAAPNTLVAGELGLSPATVAVYDAAGGTLARRAHAWNPGEGGSSNLRDMAISADGKDVILASGSPYKHQAFKLGDLSASGTYTSDAYPNAVAVAPDGTVAGGIDGFYEPDVYVFRPGTQTPFRTYEFAGSTDYATLRPNGLAFTADSTRLFAVTDTSAGDIALRILVDANKADATLALSAPATSRPNRTLTVTGTLTSPDPLPAGAQVSVTRTGPADGIVTELPTATVAADGTFTVTDRPSHTGTYTYRVAFAGDAHHRPASAEVSVSVQR
ncbi:hypothetical protein HUT18_20705 [Streptomyces sp. NA04227]|uniref:hypothetical protein n=1 Tax=Streptomyces sp. NA04227 TaxID=2742136 RepID=UPI0015912076|nr:hypothetical protein [Streptomyces sp. NA04227]QKW08431.1 hypothetical protein HUT18_20705 [Streptomyces sp. NA04227]